MCTKNVRYALQKVLILVLCLVLLTVNFTLVSCKKTEIEYDESEVLTKAAELLKSAEIVNSIFYGRGIAYVAGLNQNGIYCEADYTHLYSLGLRSLLDMKKLCVDTYSEGISYMIFSATTDVSGDGSGNYLLARYYAPSEEPQRLMVNTNYKQIFDDKMTFNYDTLKVVGAEGERIKLTIEASVRSTDENKTDAQELIINVYLVEEESGYRIDNFVFANYNDAL